MNKTILATGMTVLAFGSLIFSGVHSMNNANAETQLNNKLTTAQEKLKAKKHKVDEKIILESSHSTNKKLQFLSANKNEFDEVNDKVQQFFTAYYTWKNGSDYRQRKDSLKGVASPSILNNKQYFDNGLDSSGDSYIDVLQLVSQFNSASTAIEKYDTDNGQLTALVSVSYLSQEGSAGAHEGLKWFRVQYDTKQHYITSFDPIYFNKNVNNGDSSEQD